MSGINLEDAMIDYIQTALGGRSVRPTPRRRAASPS
jgi:hypothetical protein